MNPKCTKLIYALIALLAMGLWALQPMPAVAQKNGTTLIASKSATGHWTRTFSWAIDKSVDQPEWSLFNGDNSTSRYTITVTKDNGTNVIWVDGQICVTNDGAIPTEGLLIWDDVLYKTGAGQFQILTSAQVNTSANPVLNPGEEYCYPYSINITPVANAQYKNSARITITNHSGHAEPFGPSPDDGFSLPATPTLVNDAITVNDDMGTPDNTGDDNNWPLNVSGSVTYDRSFTCPNDPAKYIDGRYEPEINIDNTAKILETNQTDSAKVKLHCYIPVATKTAEGSYTEKHDWNVTKSASPTVLAGFAGGSAGSTTWTVKVDETVTEAGFTVKGTISVKNPNPNAGMTVALTDLLDDNTAATITTCSGDANLADGLTVAANSSATCNYTASPSSRAATKNTATVTLNNIAYSAEAAVTFVPTVVGPTAVTVSDDRAPGGTFTNPVTDNAEFNYEESFACSPNSADYDANGKLTTTYPNQALLTDGANTIDSSEAAVRVDCYIPLVSKTAAGAYDERHIWDIEKSVAPAAQAAFVGDTVAYQWTVTLNETVKEEKFVVSGQITVQNPNPTAELTVNLADTLDDGTAASLSGCTGGALSGAALTIPASGSAICDYTAAPIGRTATANNVAAELNGILFTAMAPVKWVANVIDPAVTVDDDQNLAFPTTVQDGSTWTYDEEYTCSTDQTAYNNEGMYSFTDTNTAAVAAKETTLDSASAKATVNCYAPTISTTADPHYTRDWTWTVDKIADQTALTLTDGQKHLVNYKVTANATKDEKYAVIGTITVKNLHPNASMTVALVDSADGSIATIGPCTNGVYNNGNLTIDPSATAVCEYEAILSAPTDGTNTAAATIGGSVFQATAEYTFDGPNSETDECIEVTDDKDATVRTVCAADASKTFTYSLYVGPYTCGAEDKKYEFINTASFKTNDTGATGSDPWTVVVTVPACQQGCTLTQGYWKTHSNKGPAPYDDTWAKIGESTTFFLSGKSYYDVLWTAPAGNSYYNLAHQYIAANLNQLNGANFTAAQSAFDAATTLLKKYTPAQVAAMKANDPVRKQFISLAATLDQYNNGLIGPGHCSEGTGVGGVGFDEAIQRVFLPTIRNQ